MTKSKGVGRGSNPNSQKSLDPVSGSGRVPIVATLRMSPAKAEKLRQMANTSGAIAEFISLHFDELVAFEASWNGDRSDN